MLKVFCDGGSRGNPGPAACAFIIYDDAGNIRQKCGKYLGTATNNEAEYQAVIETLSYLSSLRNLSDLNFFLDSLLVINQLNGLWKIKEPRLKELFLKIKQLEQFNNLTIVYTHIPREQNREADALVNTTLDKNLY